MALPPSNVEDNIARQADEIEGETTFTKPKEEVPTEIYRLDPKSKVPVSKYEGPLWASRKAAGMKAINEVKLGWEEAEYYYNNTQQNHRKETGGNRAGNRNYGKDRRDSFSMTENAVYSTVNAVIPNIYAKNPNVEVTMTDANLERIGVMLEHLLNKLASLKFAPGIGLKAKARKCVVRCEITNEAWMLVGWNMKMDSADEAQADIQRLGKELAEAKDQKDIERIEGELLALEETVDLLDPAGPFARTYRGDQVLIDPASTEDDHTDAQWIMCEVMFATKYLNARYRIKKPDGSYANPYKPSHVVDAGGSSTVENTQQQIDNFKLFDYNEDVPNKYGYADRDAYERAKRTKCWYVFDKVKRRFYLFADNDWSWPVWCFEDPYHFPDFYPLVKLQYHTDPKAVRVRGEVSHYLDQQDEINTIVDEGNRARINVRDNLWFDSSGMTNKEAEDAILNSNKKIKGIKVPEGKKLDELFGAPPMPSLEYQFLWQKDSAYRAINMISGVMEAQRGEQYKTNTTNEAIEQYNSISGVRLDEKRDAIEDFIGDVMYKVLFLCLQFMDQATVAQLVGPQYAQEVSAWQNMTPEEIRTLVVCRVEGGSTVKPTSAAKKAEALQIGQILGQFARVPQVVMVVLTMLQRAFDSVNMTDNDWQMLKQSLMAPQPGAGGPQQQGDPEAIVADLVSQGMPEEQARAEVERRMNGQAH